MVRAAHGRCGPRSCRATSPRRSAAVRSLARAVGDWRLRGGRFSPFEPRPRLGEGQLVPLGGGDVLQTAGQPDGPPARRSARRVLEMCLREAPHHSGGGPNRAARRGTRGCPGTGRIRRTSAPAKAVTPGTSSGWMQFMPSANRQVSPPAKPEDRPAAGRPTRARRRGCRGRTSPLRRRSAANRWRSSAVARRRACSARRAAWAASAAARSRSAGDVLNVAHLPQPRPTPRAPRRRPPAGSNRTVPWVRTHRTDPSGRSSRYSNRNRSGPPGDVGGGQFGGDGLPGSSG